jgi:sterol desaturase/sphingolipid hydroxylase (fatty acid hydroxylase superfamily)
MNIYIGSAILIFLLLEFTFPINQIKFKPYVIFQDLFWMITNRLIFPIVRIQLAINLAQLFRNHIPQSKLFISLESYNQFLQAILLFILIDLVSYLIHYFIHRTPFLWKFHKLHHSSEELTSLSAFRHSWIDSLINIIGLSLINIFFHFSEELKFPIMLLFEFVCIYQHSNISFNLPKLLNFIFISNHLHRIHHAKTNLHKYGQNFGFCLRIWDKLLKTEYAKEASHLELGLNDLEYPKNWISRFFYPLIPTRLTTLHRLYKDLK